MQSTTKAHQLIEDKARWTIRADSRDQQGLPVDPIDPQAVYWCARGAIIKCYANPEPTLKLVNDESFKRHSRGLCGVNDSLGHGPIWNIMRDLDI